MLCLLFRIIVISSLPLIFSYDGAAPARPGAQKPSGTSPDEPAPLRINTDMVTLSVGVSDKKRRPIANLTKDHFEIFEDGKPQAIEFFGQEDQPISFGLLIDRSQSMNDSGKIESAKAVAISFLRAGNPQNEAFCLAFNESQWMVADFTADFAKVESNLAGLQPEGGTALYDAIIEGLEKLGRARHRRRALVVITDGRDQNSRRSLADLVKRAQQSDAQIYTVGFYSPAESAAYKYEGRKVKLSDGSEVDNPRLVFQTLANETGAETFFPKSNQEFAEAINQIAASLRRQYTLAYYPTNQSSGSAYRRIRVKVKGDHGAIKTRQGYRLPDPLTSAPETRTATAPPKEPPKRIQSLQALAPQFLREKFDGAPDSPVKWPQSGNCSVKNGKLHMAEDCAVPAGDFIYDNFEAAVTATFLSRPRQPASANSAKPVNLQTIGFSFRINENGCYQLLIAPPREGGIGSGGFYKLLKIAGGEKTELTPWRKDSAIAMRNLIELRCAGPKMEIYVNSLRLGSLNDGAHKRGSISLLFSGDAGTFDDLTIKKLN